MRYLAGLLLLLALPSTLAAPQRIASLNLCTDLLLLELVPRERIVSLTYWAADPVLSRLSGRVGDIPLNHSLAEEIVPRRPDLVLAGQFSDVQVIGLLRKLGYRVEVMQVPLTLEGMHEHLLAFGEIVGEQRRAGELAERIDARLAAVAERARGEHRPLAAVYGPQGVSAGRDTLMNDLLHLAGYRNLAAERGIESYGTLSLEALVMAEPDVLVIDDLSLNRDSVAHQALRHPALARQFPPDRVISLPPSLTACVGPGVADAAERLATERPAR